MLPYPFPPFTASLKFICWRGGNNVFLGLFSNSKLVDWHTTQAGDSELTDSPALCAPSIGCVTILVSPPTRPIPRPLTPATKWSWELLNLSALIASRLSWNLLSIDAFHKPSDKDPVIWINQAISRMSWICPEMQVNEMHALYDKHHKVSYFLIRHQKTINSVKYEVIWKGHCDAYSLKSIESHWPSFLDRRE